MIALVIAEVIADEVVERVLGATGYARSNTDRGSVVIELGRFGDGRMGLRARDLGRGLLAALARELLVSCERVDVVAIDSLGREEGTAWGLSVSRRRAVEIDADQTLQDLIDGWLAESDDQRLYLDDDPGAVLGALASELLDIDEELEPERTLRFASEVPERLVPVLGALAGGAPFEWTELAGQPAIRVTLSSTDSILKALDPAEVSLLEALTGRLGR